tara:strand:+ start:124 stop:810 length:687 start_codon:yes stop_codon:yes gene_type:complete
MLSYYNFSLKNREEILIEENKLLENVLNVGIGKKITPDTGTIYLNLKNLKMFNSSSEGLLINQPIFFLSIRNNIQILKTLLDFLLNKYQKRVYSTRTADYFRREKTLVKNDGAICHKLEFTKFDDIKYIVKISNLIEEKKLIIWINGIMSRNNLVHHFLITINKNILEYRILKAIFKEKINTQIRRIAGLLGLKILSLISFSFKKLSLGNLKESHLRLFNKSVFEDLK